MDINNLANKSSKQSTQIDFNLQQYWKNFVETAVTEENITIINVDSGKTSPYIYNFYGLLHNILNIARDYWLPNLFINGYKTSLDYLGDTKIKIINPEILEEALDHYTTLQKIKNNN